jgi:antitoxin component of MazEF toxin-antitoxin module
MELTFKTKIGRAKSNGNSLKTTIPMTLIKMMGLENGDVLKWNCEIKDNKVLINIEPEITHSK